MGGLTAALAIAAALAGRASTGQGCFLDVSMLEAAISAMGWTVSNYLVSGAHPEPMGDENATAAPSGTFDAADGPLNIAANSQEQFETLCQQVGRPAWPPTRGSPTARRVSGTVRPAHREMERRCARRTALSGSRSWRRRGARRADPDRAEAAGLGQLGHRGFFTTCPTRTVPAGRCGSGGTACGSTACRGAAAPPPFLGQDSTTPLGLPARKRDSSRTRWLPAGGGRRRPGSNPG